MTPAAYTPTTLARIRSGATAGELGWDQARFHRICARHGMTDRIPAPTKNGSDKSSSVVSAPLANAAMPRFAALARVRNCSVYLVTEREEPADAAASWCFLEGRLSIGTREVTLKRPLHIRVVDTLFDAWRRDQKRYVCDDNIPGLASLSGAERGNSLHALRRALIYVGFTIDGRTAGAYRLALIK